MKKFFVSFVLIALLIVIFEFIFSELDFTIIPEIVAAAIVSLLYSQWKWIGRYFNMRINRYTLPNLPSSTRIRISYAYLIRIKIQGKYLLVRGKYNKYQPPGGVYHYYDREIERQFGFKRDETHGDDNDIRGTIELSSLKKFLKWRKTEKNRETGFTREFNEELIQSKILSEKEFSGAEGEFITTKFKGIEFSEHHQIYELLIFDIFQIILDDSQRKVLLALLKEPNDRCYFSSAAEIKSLGVSGDNYVETIAKHSKLIL